MEFDWREYLRLAERLRQSGEEAALRTALSRTYYWVYHLSRLYAEENSYSERTAPGRGSHEKLWKWCEAQSDLRLKKLGFNGNRMRKLRNNADYNSMPIGGLGDEVSRQLQRARECEKLVRTLRE
ncbi:MAG: hypothetical protein KJZ79_05460 [Bryobacteraceae bacterium]|nr:hypothetical protein [Bryobacteraceae bacterium]